MARTRDRLREWEARILILRIAASYPNNEATNSQIKEAVPSLVKLTLIDLEPSSTRSDECKWQQVIDNVIFTRRGMANIFDKGYAICLDDGIRVTEEGLAFLKMWGY